MGSYILGIFPTVRHVDLRAMYMKEDYDPPPDQNVTAIWGRFLGSDPSILFHQYNSNPAEGDTDWLYHINKIPSIISDPYGFLGEALYNSAE